MTKLWGDGLCGCGCGGRTSTLYGRFRRYLKGHHQRCYAGDIGVEYVVENRGWKTPCWVWQLAITKSGYAHRNARTGSSRVHVQNYIKVHGPVPSGKILDHLCEVRSCINPDHTEPVPPKVNVQRGKSAKVTPEQVAIIRQSYLDGDSQTGIASQYGISQQQVSKIVRGERWKEAA